MTQKTTDPRLAAMYPDLYELVEDTRTEEEVAKDLAEALEQVIQYKRSKGQYTGHLG